MPKVKIKVKGCIGEIEYDAYLDTGIDYPHKNKSFADETFFKYLVVLYTNR